MYVGQKAEPLPNLSAVPLDPKESARLVGRYAFGPDYYVPNSSVKIVARIQLIDATH
jgi:hypothetical protein